MLNNDEKQTQACGGKGCKSCGLLFGLDDEIVVNGKNLILDRKLNCKDKSIVYVAQCTICSKQKQPLNNTLVEDTYFGQTSTELHTRFNDHRNKFKVDTDKVYEKSALSKHCFDKHPDYMDLNVFKIGIVKQCTPNELDREESRFISKFRAKTSGLNRIKVVR